MTTQATRHAFRPQAFPRRSRVTERRDFERSRAVGRRSAGPGFVLEVSTTAGPVRLGLAVSRRVGGAVVRNRLKRRVRDWFRRSRPALPESVDLVVIARPQAANYSSEAISAELTRLVAQARK